jgi:hypothetical protein
VLQIPPAQERKFDNMRDETFGAPSMALVALKEISLGPFFQSINLLRVRLFWINMSARAVSQFIPTSSGAIGVLA